MNVTVISPHLDDAVFSCGTMIAALALVGPVEVVTVFAGQPELEGQAAQVAVRRREDVEALTLLGATWRHLDVLDGCYEQPDGRTDRIRGQLDLVLARPGKIISPIGIRHADHRAVAVACASRYDIAYEELPYRVLWPEHLPPFLTAPSVELPASALKMEAVRRYESQLGGPVGESLFAGERFHRKSLLLTEWMLRV